MIYATEKELIEDLFPTNKRIQERAKQIEEFVRTNEYLLKDKLEVGEQASDSRTKIRTVLNEIYKNIESSINNICIVQPDGTISLDESAIRTSIIKTKKKKRYILYLKKTMIPYEYIQKIHNYIGNIISYFPLSDRVFSYREGISTRKCAKEHVKRNFLLSIDFKDYFYSITRKDIEVLIGCLLWYANAVKGRIVAQFIKDSLSFKRLNEKDPYDGTYDYLKLISYNLDKFPHSHHPSKTSENENESIVYGSNAHFRLIAYMAQFLAGLITVKNPYTNDENYDNYVLPIGFSSSPPIANAILYSFDVQAEAIAKKYNSIYSRYSDNLFLSTDNEETAKSMLEEIKNLCATYRLSDTPFLIINEKKTQIRPRTKRQRVLGIVVNEKTSYPRQDKNRLRSAVNHSYYEALNVIESDINHEEKVEKAKKYISKLKTTIGLISYATTVDTNLNDVYKYRKPALMILNDVLRTIAKEDSL